MPPEPARLKLLLVTRNLPPLVGGMERLMLNVARGADSHADVTVIGPRGCSQHLPDSIDVLEAPPGLAPFLLTSLWLALRSCAGNRFDLVVGGSGLVAPTLYLLQLVHGVRTAVFVHGLDLTVDNVLYRRLFLPCIRRVKHIVANSRNTRDIARDLGIPAGRITLINPGTDLPALPSTDSIGEFHVRHDIPFDRTILFVGRITQRKGLSAFIEHCLGAVLREEPGAGLLVVGENPDSSLNRLGEHQRVMEVVEQSGFRQRVRFLGHVSEEDLAIAYAAADVLILPLVEVAGDIEGFGMVAIEAAACGTPTVAFNLGGVADAVSQRNGFLVQPGRYDQFARDVLQVLRTGEPGRERCLAHSREFSWDVYNTRFRETVQALTR